MHISVFDPVSPEAGRLLWLWDASMWICGFILALVTLSILYILVRYRRRGPAEPNQTTGNPTIEIVWTVVPLGLVLLLFALSIVTARAVDHPIRQAPDLVVIGHQWWWEVHYSAMDAVDANEIHLPTGREMLVAVESADVIHDFWAPQLSRKVDAVPGKRNFVWIRVDRAGVYPGACAEYCGQQHAWMRLRVIAQDPAAYETWLAHEAQPAAEPQGGDAALGRMRFGQLTCANCHNIRGIQKQQQYAPDLTHVASRQMLAAERLENTPANLKDWLRHPNVIKPGCYMPNLNLSDSDLTQLTAFLETLR